jgi:DNA polymerase IV
VHGAPCPEAEETNPTNETPSTASLPLKPIRKQQVTPTPSQDSRDQCVGDPTPELPVDGEQRSNETHQEQSVPELSSRERDALDDMIEAAKAAKDLVSVDTLSTNMTADPNAAFGPSGGRLCRSKRY